MSKISDKISYKIIFELFPDPILIIDKNELKIRVCNQEMQNLLKKSNDYLFGKKIEDIFHNEYYFNSNIREISKNYGTFTIKDKLNLDNLFFEIKCVVSDDLEKNIILIFKNIDKKEDEDDNQNLEFFNEIFAILSHEINNPISSIKLASDLIKRNHNDVDSELINIIKSEALRITRLFTNFNLSESKHIRETNEENIHEIIRLCLFKIKQMPNKLKIIEEFDPSLPLIKISRDLLIQVFDNIFINAYESSNFLNNSYIKVQTRFVVGESIKIPNIKNSIKKSALSIIISENGSGISPETMNKIFLPFFSTKKRGTGIGLFLVKKIINEHDGTINIESENGITLVKINLPF